MMRKAMTIIALGLGMMLILSGISSVQSVLAGQDKGFVEKGRQLYQKHCAVCHGLDAKGNGPAASELKTQPSDLTVLQKPGAEFPIYEVLTFIEGEKVVPAHGTREMPIWGTVFRRTKGELQGQGDIYALAKYLEAVQQNRK